MRSIVFLLFLSCSGVCIAQQSRPESVVADLYRAVVELHPLGVPRGGDLTTIRPFLSKRMLQKFEDVRICEKSYRASHPSSSTKPPFKWLERGLFSGGNEQALPSAAKIEGEAKQKDGSYIIRVRLEYSSLERSERSSFAWEVAATVVAEGGRFVIDDIFIPDDLDLQSRRSIYDSLSGCRD